VVQITKRVVVALGGNAILRAGQRGTIEEQRENVALAAAQIQAMLRSGLDVVITHGNGPQVGNILRQNEECRRLTPAMPLDVCGAETQGQIGYLLQQALGNALAGLETPRKVITVLTQVIVDREDPAFARPTKPIGPFYREDEAQALSREKGYIMQEDVGRGWRRVVPSPQPLEIYERDIIRRLVQAGAVVIAAGGGGVPVVRTAKGLSGVEAVIDKDLAAACLAAEVKAQVLLILTDVSRVCLNFRQPDQRELAELDLDSARRYLADGQFKAGSMGPKVQAVVRFLESGGEYAVIGSLAEADKVWSGEAGTVIRSSAG